MAAAEPALVRRHRAAQAVVNRFDGKAFRLGRRDCVTLSADLLKRLGHKVPVIPAYRDEIGAVRRLKEQGADNLAELLDKIGLPRIPPAAALIGDLLYQQDDGGRGIGCIGIALGNGAMMGFHEDHAGLVRMRAIDISAAWSVL